MREPSNMTVAEVGEQYTPTTNFTSVFNESVTEVDTIPFRIVGVVIGLFVIFVGSVGNALTFLAILNNKKLHRPFHIFIGNLCVIDFLTASLMLPFNVNAYFTGRWPFPDNPFTCCFMAFSYYCCGYTSIVCLLVITTNRFIGVVYPEDYDKFFTRRRIILTIAISWICAPAFLTPFFFFSGGGFGWNERLTLCVFNTKNYNEAHNAYMLFTRVLFQLIPLLMMIVLYTKIFITSKQSGQAVAKISLRKTSSNGFAEERSRTYSDSARLSPMLRRVVSSFRKANTSFGSPVPGSSNCGSVRTSNCTVNSERNTSNARNHLQNPQHNKFSPVLDRRNELICVNAMQHSRVVELSLPVKSICLEDNERSISAPTSPILGGNGRHFISSLHGSGKRTPESRGSSFLSKSNLGLHRTMSKSGKYSSVMKLEARKRKMLDMRLLVISVTICTAFTTLFLPSVIVNLLGVKDPRWHMFASVITWLNSCVNPVIYCFMNAKMREQYRLLVLKGFGAICRCFNIRKENHKVTRRSTFRSSSRH